jgi:hypothetical protein
MWRAVSLPGNGSAMDTTISAQSPFGTSVETAITQLTALIERHPSLRTCIETGQGGHVRQRVLGSGSIPVHVMHTPSITWESEIEEMLPPADGSPPVRALVTATAGRVTNVALRLSHVLADEWGVKLILDDLTAQLAGSRCPAAGGTGRAATSSVDIAGYEASPAGQHANSRALTYLRRQFSSAPQTLFPHRPLPGTPPRYWSVELRSRAMLTALARTQAGAGTMSSGLITGMFAAVMAARASLPSALIYVMAGNRTSRWPDFSGPLLQDAPMCIPVAGRSLAELARETARSALQASFYGQHSPAGRQQCIDEIELERGVCIDKLDRMAAVNFHISVRAVQAHTDAAGTARSASELQDLMRFSSIVSTPRTDLANVTFFLDVFIDNASLVLHARVDTCMVSLAEAAAILTGMEKLMCTPGDVSADDVRQLCPGMDRGITEDTFIVDHSRVSLDECTQVLASHPDVGRAHLRLDDAGQPAITAHVQARTRDLDPGSLHRFVVAELPRHPLAMAPRLYRIHSNCPARPDDVPAWESEPDLAVGAGRP